MVRRGLPMGRLDMNLLRSWRFVLPNHNSPRMSGGIITLMEAGMAGKASRRFFRIIIGESAAPGGYLRKPHVPKTEENKKAGL